MISFEDLPLWAFSHLVTLSIKWALLGSKEVKATGPRLLPNLLTISMLEPWN